MNSIHLYQIIVTAIAAIMIYQGIMNFVKGKTSQTFLKLFIRITVWGGMALIAIFPKFTIALAKVIGLEGNINAVILTGFILIFLIIFKLLSAIERLEQDLSVLTRKDALKEIKNQNRWPVIWTILWNFKFLEIVLVFIYFHID